MSLLVNILQHSVSLSYTGSKILLYTFLSKMFILFIGRLQEIILIFICITAVPFLIILYSLRLYENKNTFFSSVILNLVIIINFSDLLCLFFIIYVFTIHYSFYLCSLYVNNRINIIASITGYLRGFHHVISQADRSLPPQLNAWERRKYIDLRTS